MINIRIIWFVLILVFAVGCGDRPPRIEQVRAMPDSVPRGGVAYLRVQASDPARGGLSFRWEATHGTVMPDTGDSTVYFAPAFDADDTVSVLATGERGLTAEGSVVITVREGLCGGRPDILITTDARLLAADSTRVFYVEPAGGRWEIRRMSTDGLDRDTIATRPYEIRRLSRYGEALYWLERDPPGPDARWRVMTAAADDTLPPTVITGFPAISATVYDIAADAGRVHIAWLETVEETLYVARVSSYPRLGGPGQERFAFTGPVREGTAVSRVAADGNELFFLVTSNEPDRVAVMKAPATGEPVLLVGPDRLAPGTLAITDQVAVAGGEVFWSERVQGRIGRVGRDGSGAEFIVPASGDAQEVELLLAAAGPAGAGPRLFWAVPGELRGMVVSSGGVIRDLGRGPGEVRGMAANQRHLFYIKGNGVSRMYRVLIP